MSKFFSYGAVGKARIVQIFAITTWAIFAGLTAIYLIHPIHDGDTWWHLANGRYMLENHVFLRQDVFSHTLQGAPWINFEWLSQIIMYGAVKCSGLGGLLALKTILSATALCLLILCIHRMGTRGPVLFLLALIGYNLIQSRLCTRVELATLNLLPIFVLVLLSKHKHTPWILSGLMVLWCNLHGGFLYGIALVYLFAIGRSALLVTLASFINPFGPKIYQVFIQHWHDFRSSSGLISEWDPVTLKSSPLFFLCCALCAALAVQAVIKKNKSALIWLPALVLFAFIGSTFARNTALFAFVAMPFLAACLAQPSMQLAKKPWMMVLAWALLMWLVVPPALAIRQLPKITAVNSSTIPKGACEFVEREKIEGKLFNTYGYGGYIEWALGPAKMPADKPSIKTFMDGRYIFYPLLAEEQQFNKGPYTEEVWQKYFNRYGVDYAITKYEPLRLMRPWNLTYNHESIMNIMFPMKEWALVYWDGSGLVFVRRTPKYSALIKQKEYKVTKPFDLPWMVNRIVTGDIKIKDVNAELARHETEAGPSPLAVALQNHLNAIAQKRNINAAPVEHR